MKKLLFFISFCVTANLNAQELYVFTEPASNMPAKSITFNVTAKFPDNKNDNIFRNRYMPQVVVGVNKNLMLHAASSFSNYYSADKLQYDGSFIYAKYRFLSKDKVHQHFRMAAFAEAGYSTHQYVYDEMNLEGESDGLIAGLIATQLVHKFAVSATASYMQMFVKDKKIHRDILGNITQMFNYSLSMGYLVLPKEYVSYNQTNLNVYLELLGAKSTDGRDYNLDIAPALQLIFNSNTKLNFGTRFQVKSNMSRPGQNIFQVALETTLLNAW